jgi:hypothetical protein
MPVSGPTPFTTLVFVQKMDSVDDKFRRESDGILNFGTQTFASNFRWPDERTIDHIVFRHSTMAWLIRVAQGDDANFTVAIDAVKRAFFDDDPSYSFDWRIAISSWVLCNLPPEQTPLKRDAR